MKNTTTLKDLDTQLASIAPKTWVKQSSYVGDDGIWIPVNEYVPEGSHATYRCLITKDLFVEAYNKWIKNNEGEK